MNVTDDKRLPSDEEKRGGYRGSGDAATVPPPAKIPSGSVNSTSNTHTEK
jgi:hypothetical protein